MLEGNKRFFLPEAIMKLHVIYPTRVSMHVVTFSVTHSEAISSDTSLPTPSDLLEQNTTQEGVIT